MNRKPGPNDGLLAPIHSSISQLEQEIAVLEERIRLYGVSTAFLDDLQWKPIVDRLRTLMDKCINQCVGRELAPYEQGRLHGIILAVRLICKRPFENDQEYKHAVDVELPGLREELSVIRSRLEPRYREPT